MRNPGLTRAAREQVIPIPLSCCVYDLCLVSVFITTQLCRPHTSVAAPVFILFSEMLLQGGYSTSSTIPALWDTSKTWDVPLCDLGLAIQRYRWKSKPFSMSVPLRQASWTYKREKPIRLVIFWEEIASFRMPLKVRWRKLKEREEEEEEHSSLII